MIVILNTRTDDRAALRLHTLLSERDQETVTFHTAEMKIAHCMGCNHCFLKTPGICAIKDDYEQILGQLAHTDQLWLVADTHFRFVDAKGKRVMDRLLPLLNMGLEFRQGLMRHQLRYQKPISVGIVYAGEADLPLLEFWSQRVAGNLGGESLGVYSIDKVEEGKLCM